MASQASSFLVFLFVGQLILLLSTNTNNNGQVDAYTEVENFAFIDKILEKLNNSQECELPTYEEVDEMNKSFQELDSIYGNDLDNKLTVDQRLVRVSLLFQWESFAKRLTDGVVIKSAKKRSFLCKIEEYQEAKFGVSICTQIKLNNQPIPDNIFEKNPLVRYIKHLETQQVPEPEPEVVEPKVPDLVIRTPIVEVKIVDLDEAKPDASNEDKELKKDIVDTFDPLADIPVPPAVDSAPNSEINDAIASSTENPLPDLNLEPEVTTITPSFEPATTSEPTITTSEPTITTSETTITTSEPSTSVVDPEVVESDVKDVVSDSESASNDDASSDQPLSDTNDGVEYVDDYLDDQDLNRLDKVAPLKWDLYLLDGDLVWPDENKNDATMLDVDESAEKEWRNFLEDPEAAIATPRRPAVPPRPIASLPEAATVIPRRPAVPPRSTASLPESATLPPKSNKSFGGNFRRRREEFMKNARHQERRWDADERVGWNKQNFQGDAYLHKPPVEDDWQTVLDGGFCRISYNKAPITNSVNKIKSIKKRLIS